MSVCVCGSGLEFAACCEPILAGQPAPTAEALMRSRYAAYAVGNLDHLERTATSEAREAFNRADAEQVADETTWLGLEIRQVVDGGVEDETGQVEFVFRYRLQGRKMMQHELADFRREDGLWLYQGSQMNPKSPPVRVSKVNRNDPCACGSGKKAKKCCGV
ncbi:YchJ family protein [Thiobaca trueperi]|uniref:SEC-C motif-containing protein n=1 Tax=Thiobaca trueperi TaxID=127458 RepID=A0A4V2V187_9GAMM|nr:YchJ family protein [Thiobaca trueperi]TCT20242.1 SEC-C motif-containing protein [Thiobaca trueperi]